jgi:hypothetical protein
LTSLHRAGFKSSLLQSFLQAINNPLQTPAVLFEDNKGTINLIRTQRLTDTVRHHDVKLAWLNENFLRGTFTVAYSKSVLMLVDCSTKPAMVPSCFNRFPLQLVLGSTRFPRKIIILPLIWQIFLGIIDSSLYLLLVDCFLPFMLYYYILNAGGCWSILSCHAALLLIF